MCQAHTPDPTHTPHTKKYYAGSDLLSHTLPSAVPSAQADLASGFGMGPGVTLPLTPPTKTRPTTTHHTNTGVGGVMPDTEQQTRAKLSKIHKKSVLTFGQLVPVTSTPHSASRSGLSTPSSLGGLTRNLISEQASRLDAFSGYPFRT